MKNMNWKKAVSLLMAAALAGISPYRLFRKTGAEGSIHGNSEDRGKGTSAINTGKGK